MIKGLNCLSIAFLFSTLPGCDASNWLYDQIHSSGNLTLPAIVSILIVGSFFSGDLVCLGAGVWSAQGQIPFWMAVLVCSFGAWFSAVVIYFWSALGRRGLLHRFPLKWIVKPEKMVQGSVLFQKHGAKVILLSRFLPGMRLPVYLSAGILRYPFPKFAFWLAVASVVWATPMVWLAMVLGDALLGWLEVYEKATWIALPIIGLLIWGGMQGLEWFFKRRGRLLDSSTAKDAPSPDQS